MPSRPPAVVAKNVLSQCTTLIVHQLTGAADQNAMAKWFGDHGTAEEQKAVTGSLSSLNRGEAWIWTPGMGQLVRAKMRKRRTFDSSATPKFGERPVVPKRLVAPYLADLRERFAIQVEAAKENDVDVLKAKNKKLTEENAQLKARPATGPEKIVTVTETVTEQIEVPVFKEGEAERLRETADDLLAMAEQVQALAALGKDLRAVGEEIKAALAKSDAQSAAAAKPPVPLRAVETPTAPGTIEPAGAKPAMRRTKPSAARSSTGSSGNPLGLPPGARKMLDVFRGRTDTRLTVANLGTLAGMAHRTSGTFAGYLRDHVSSGRLAYDGNYYRITDAGLQALGMEPGAALPPAQTTGEILEGWRPALKGRAFELLRLLVTAYPGAVSQASLANSMGLTVGAGTFGGYKNELTRNGLVESTGSGLRATSALFPETLKGNG